MPRVNPFDPEEARVERYNRMAAEEVEYLSRQIISGLAFNCIPRYRVAEILHISRQTLARKLDNPGTFTTAELSVLKQICGIHTEYKAI